MERAKTLLRIKSALEEAGFQTSDRSTFMMWMHPEWKKDANRMVRDGTTLYISGIPVPEIAPVDFAEASLHVDNGLLYFSFTLYFVNILKDAIEEDDFRRIQGEHDRQWFPRLKEYFLSVSSRFSLDWDIEYDECIEDSLCGNFVAEESNRVIEAVWELKGLNVGAGRQQT